MSRLVALLPLDNCLDCPHHRKITSPYTDDSFDMSDEDVICVNEQLKDRKECRGQFEKVLGRPILLSERWRLREQCTIPDWCPLPKKNVGRQKVKGG
jgi:hypothetical protein